MDRFERAAAVGRFNGGDARVLLATDAAGEGLNLQQRCRLVVNLELPWNPMRLEQRIGRVDRIGQQRTVHAINLLASGTAESGLLLRLARRINQARHTVGAVEDVLGGSEEGLMAACLGLQRRPPEPRGRARANRRDDRSSSRSAPRSRRRRTRGGRATSHDNGSSFGRPNPRGAGIRRERPRTAPAGSR